MLLFHSTPSSFDLFIRPVSTNPLCCIQSHKKFSISSYLQRFLYCILLFPPIFVLQYFKISQGRQHHLNTASEWRFIFEKPVIALLCDKLCSNWYRQLIVKEWEERSYWRIPRRILEFTIFEYKRGLIVIFWFTMLLSRTYFISLFFSFQEKLCFGVRFWG